jgi:hypothetical protein
MPDYDGPERRKNPSSNDWDWRRELQNEWDADRRRRGTHRRDKSAEKPKPDVLDDVPARVRQHEPIAGG